MKKYRLNLDEMVVIRNPPPERTDDVFFRVIHAKVGIKGYHLCSFVTRYYATFGQVVIGHFANGIYDHPDSVLDATYRLLAGDPTIFNLPNVGKKGRTFVNYVGEPIKLGSWGLREFVQSRGGWKHARIMLRGTRLLRSETVLYLNRMIDDGRVLILDHATGVGEKPVYKSIRKGEVSDFAIAIDLHLIEAAPVWSLLAALNHWHGEEQR